MFHRCPPFPVPAAGAFLCWAACLIARAPAQEKCYVPADGHVVAVRFTDLQALVEAVEKTRFAQLLQEPELREALDLAIGRYEERDAVVGRLLETVEREKAGVRLDDALRHLRGLEDGLREVRAWLWIDDDGEPTMVFSATADDAAGEELRQAWRRASAHAVDSGDYRTHGDPPVLDGRPAAAIAAVEEDDVDGPAHVWYWHDGSRHLVGFGTAVHAGAFRAGEPPADGTEDRLGGGSGVVVHLALLRILEKAMAESEPEERELGQKRREAFGFAEVTGLTLALSVEGEHLRESLWLELAGEPTGLLGAWTAATAPLPAHPQVEDAMLQMGLAFDMQRLPAAVEAIAAVMADGAPEAGAEEAEDPLREWLPDLGKALTGGVSLQVSAPAPGSFVPRLSLSLGIADRAALDGLLARAREELHGLGFDDRETDGMAWTSVKIPNSPSALVPSFAVLGDTLLLAESPATLRATLKAKDGAATAMPTDGAPQATPGGGPLPALDVRYDLGAIWSVLQDRYLPMARLGFAQMQMSGEVTTTPLLTASEMPDLEELAGRLGRGRGGLGRTERGIVLSAASPLGDPLMAAMLAVYVPLLPQIFGLAVDTATREIQGRIGAARLAKVQQALATYRASFGAGKQLPRELGELFQRGLLEGEEALLVPGDERPLAVEFEDDDGEVHTVRSSFRYAPEGRIKTTRGALMRHRARDGEGLPFVFEMFGEHRGKDGDEVTILLYEHREHPRGERLVLTADGQVHRLSRDGAKEILGS